MRRRDYPCIMPFDSSSSVLRPCDGGARGLDCLNRADAMGDGASEV